MAEASAPGKVILLGEHAVVYGEPAIAIALDLRTRVRAQARPGPVRVHGEPLQDKALPHIRRALELAEVRSDVELSIASDVPSGSGLGSSAALGAATLGALFAHRGLRPEPRDVARMAFDIELSTQEGRASPTDTTTSVAGGGVLVDGQPGPGLLWSFERPGRKWCLHRLEVPELTLVVGLTGTRGRTADQVAKVAAHVQASPPGMATIRALGDVARAGAEALRCKDLPELGRLMDRAHEGLRSLGVSTPRLDELVAAVRPHCLGAKLTGAGGGGSIIALAERAEPAVGALKARGCPAIVAHFTTRGLEVQP